MRGLPPGPGGPGVWQGARMTRDPLGFADACRDTYGEIFTLRFGSVGTTVMVSEPDLVREVLTTHAPDMPAGRANAIIEPLVGRSVLLLDDAPHLRRRRLLLPPLHGERVQRYRDVMREVTAAEVATWAPGD